MNFKNIFIIIVFGYNCLLADCNESAKRLFDDLLSNYNKLRRPSHMDPNPLVVRVKLKLSQIIEVAEKQQIMTISVWLKQIWHDTRLSWNTTLYGNVTVLYVPADMIWTPDLLLFNNAAASYNITQSTKVTLRPSGLVDWEPPALFKSMCPINVRWFPFDAQNCTMHFGSHTYTIDKLDLRHLRDENGNATDDDDEVLYGIDLTEYYPSVQWQILSIPARRTNKTYRYGPTMYSTYSDITYMIILRRLPLFYTVNIIFPVVGISFLTIFVFYLPSDSGEKVQLGISILVSLTVFFMLLTEIIPATSDVLPMIGQYLLFAMFMVSVSVLISVITLNVHFRTPATHKMPKWVKRLFLKTLPKYLFMRRPLGDDDSFRRVSTRREYYGEPGTTPSSMSLRDTYTTYRMPPHHHKHPSGTSSAPSSMKQRTAMQQRSPKLHHLQLPGEEIDTKEEETLAKKLESLYYEPAVLKAFSNICFIADLLKKKDKDDKIDEDWKFVAMVMDRIFLWVFSVVCLFGTAVIFLQADALYDNSKPLEPILTNYKVGGDSINIF